MCYDCEVPKEEQTRLGAYIFHAKKVLEKITGIDAIKYNAFAALMSAPKEKSDAIRKEIESIGKPKGWGSTLRGSLWILGRINGR